LNENLAVVSADRRVGTIAQRYGGRLEFTYDERWRAAHDGFALSLSMPRAALTHADAAVKAYLWGLLPDNEFILSQWARRFRVSANNPFALIGHVGEDVAGAMQFVTEDRLDEMRANGAAGSVQWLTEKEIADRLELLHTDTAAWRLGTDTGQFSLPGAQPKTALLYDGKRWGVPSGRMPTTHILKPAHTQLEGLPENEHLCLDIAQRIGLPAASSNVVRFEDEVAISVERFDRVQTNGRWERVHQEDCCQALGVDPRRKYESQGGPSALTVAELVRSYSTQRAQDVWTFVRSLIYNWLIAGTDAHAKNYAVLIDAGDLVRLAPLYDVASALPYPRAIPVQKAKMAMRVGGEYLVRRIGRSHWEDLAAAMRLSPEGVVVEATKIALQLPDCVSDAVTAAFEQGLRHPIVTTLKDAMQERAAWCAKALTGRG
jgi:serine/threonine-protein kinase HipA